MRHGDIGDTVVHGNMETRGTQRHGDTGTYKDMGGHRVGKKIWEDMGDRKAWGH